MEWKGRSIKTSPCNNLYMFPGVGLGVLVSKAPKVTDAMFLSASRALSRMVTVEREAEGLLLPEMDDIRRVSAPVAKAVAVEARESGLGRLMDDATLESAIAKAQWDPQFSQYRPGPLGGPR